MKFLAVKENAASERGTKAASRKQKLRRLGRDISRNRQLYILLIPVIAFYVIFCYGPMYGTSIAFMDYKPALGISGSEWVGFKHFKTFFEDPYFWRIVRNTLTISVLHIVISMPAQILLALLINELTSRKFKRLVQTITYLPHFISLVVLCGLVREFVGSDGIITDILVAFGADRENLLMNPDYYLPIHLGSALWAETGWGTIIYLSALSSIDQEQYEAADLDGAGRIQKMRHITLPSIAPTITIMLIMSLGRVMSVGYEKIILLSNTLTLEKAEVISSYVYRTSLAGSYPRFSYSTAVGLFSSVINIILVVSANKISRKLQGSALW